MREAESGLRSQLRVLQVARLEGWEVARNYIEVLKGATEDPLLIEARRRAANDKGGTDRGHESDTEEESEIEYNYSKKY